MNLHDVLHIDEFKILRVPGGWIYTPFQYYGTQNLSCFVPFHNEFKCEKFSKDGNKIVTHS